MLKSENAFRRQNVPPVNFITPTCFVANSKFVLSCNNIFEGRVRTHVVDPGNAVDIDNLIDFEFAEYLMKKREGEVH
jgi:N-acylneuraminate cytidylyltransferase